MSIDFDTVVVGAGVVGLSIARSLSESGREVLVLEKESKIGQGISSRNSEVIHSGIYYSFESLKQKLCIKGRGLLIDYCESRRIDYKMLGKLIVANSEQEINSLSRIFDNGLKNGVNDLRMIFREEIKTMEPNLRATQAIFSPSTGIVDSHGLMLALLGDLQRNGGILSCNSFVSKIEIIEGGFSISVDSEEVIEITCRELINCAGIEAQKVSKSINRNNFKVPKAYLCKGNYFSLTRKAPFSRLIYPVPNNSGLGIHLTLDLGGRARFGPDTEWIDDINYDVSFLQKQNFVDAIKKYFPELDETELHADYAGIRPKIVSRGEPAADFSIQFCDQHSIPGFVALYGIESPGLTSALAIGEYIRQNIR